MAITETRVDPKTGEHYLIDRPVDAPASVYIVLPSGKERYSGPHIEAVSQYPLLEDYEAYLKAEADAEAAAPVPATAKAKYDAHMKAKEDAEAAGKPLDAPVVADKPFAPVTPATSTAPLPTSPFSPSFDASPKDKDDDSNPSQKGKKSP